MTRRDYELLATGFNKALNTWTPDTQGRKDCIYAIHDAIMTIGDALEQDNKAFDRDRFLRDCGIEIK